MNISSVCLSICIFFSIPIFSENSALKIVNKKTSLGKFIPSDLVSFQSVQVSKKIVSDLRKLLAAGKKDGIDLKVVSGYRSYTYQKKTFERWVQKELIKNPKISRTEAEVLANTYSARPGHSEHQLGTTVDILSAENGYQFESKKKLRSMDWIAANCQKYNFKISYPKDNAEYIYEPWHIRWFPAQ